MNLPPRLYQPVIWEDYGDTLEPKYRHRLLQPMTGPEVVEWARHNNYWWVEQLPPVPEIIVPCTHQIWLVAFEVRRVDLVPLTTTEKAALSRCTYNDNQLP